MERIDPFWENLCILLMSFASLSTVIAVFENIISYSMDRKGWNRGKAVIVNMVAMILLSLPAVFGFNILSGIQPLLWKSIVYLRKRYACIMEAADNHSGSAS